MKTNKIAWWGLPLLAVATTFALVAWRGDHQQPAAGNQPAQDTVPAKKKATDRLPGDKDLDKEIRQLDEAKENLKNIDWDQIRKSLTEVQVHIDKAGIQDQVEKAMKEVNVEKIKLEVEKALKEVDFEKIQKDVDASLKHAYTEVDKETLKKQMEEVKIQVEKALSNREWEKGLTELKDIDLKNMKLEIDLAKEEVAESLKKLDKEKLNFDKDMNKAGKEIEKAKEEFKNYQELIYNLEKEGLLNTQTDYTIEYRKGQLHVNGKAQSAAVTGRYQKYFKKEKVTISKKNGEMDIDTDYDFD